MRRSIFSAKMAVKKGARSCVSTSAKIPLFGDPWIKDWLLLLTDIPIYAPLAHVKVIDIIDQANKVWNAPLIYNLFDQHNANLVVNAPFIL